MRRFSLAAGGLGLTALVSIAMADGDNLPAAAQVPAAAESTAPVETETVVREQFLKLRQENESLEAALTQSQRELQELKAQRMLSDAAQLLARITTECPQTGAAKDAAHVLRHLNAAGLLRGGSPAGDSRSSAGEPRVFVDAQQRAFVDFGQVVVNLDEGRLNRYLQVKIALQVQDEQIEQVSAQVATSKAILTNWLLGYLSDHSVESIRGSQARQRLRDEIKSEFNSVLFPDGEGQIQLVLFEQFVVQ